MDSAELNARRLAQLHDVLARRGPASHSSPREDDDLRIAAEAGIALVSAQAELQAKLDTAERTREGLLERLAGSVRENAQLDKRLERCTSNLEMVEASNRTLLATLEEDRRTIARLTAENARGVGIDAKLRALVGQRDDLRQELDAERRRATAAEGRARKATERLGASRPPLRSADSTAESEAKVGRLTRELDDARNGTTETDQATLMKARALMKLAESAPASPNPDCPPLPSAAHEGSPELLRLIESLVSENDSLRGEVGELQDMLETARQIETELRDREDALITAAAADTADSARANLMSEVVVSPPRSPRAPVPSLPGGRGWVSTQRRSLSMSVSSSTSAPSELPTPGSTVPPSLQYRPSKHRRAPSRSATDISRRTQSVDFSSAPSYFAPMTGVASPRRSAVSPGIPTLREAPSQDALGPVSVPMGEASSSQRLSAPFRQLSLVPRADASTQTDAVPATLAPPRLSHAPTALSYERSTPELTASNASDALSDGDRAAFFGSFDNSGAVPSSSDNRVAALGKLLDHGKGLFVRLKGCDVVSLEARLRKQHLPGDVKHLSKSSIHDLLREVDALRDQFRILVEQEQMERRAQSDPHAFALDPNISLVTRRDFVALVKLLRDVLVELGRLRALVNKVLLDPGSAHRLRELDSGSVGAAVDAAAGSSSFLAPLSRLLSAASAVVAPGIEVAPASPLPKPPAQRLVRPAPKQMPSSGLTSATVNVEFGSGVVRRIASVAPTDEPVEGTTRPVPGRANMTGRRGDLRSIFAGGGAGSAPEWVVLGNGRQTAAPFGRQAAMPSPLSRQANAVLDTFADPRKTPSTGAQSADLLHRTLRPRGLSDSSIRSTFEEHAATSARPVARLLTPAALALSSEPSTRSASATMVVPESGRTRAAVATPLSSSPATAPMAMPTAPATHGLFGNLSAWASRTASSPLASAMAADAASYRPPSSRRRGED